MKNYSWKNLLHKEKKKLYFINLIQFLNEQRLKNTIYPHKENVFNAFKYTPFCNIKVVIIGQDPYPNEGQANGLAFSVHHNCTILPPSLKNIYKEINNNGNYLKPLDNGCLIHWAKQGVLLLNTILTVEKKKPMSHSNCGWKIFTNKVIHCINKFKKNIVFLLWGSAAQKTKYLINQKKQFVLSSSHPSPLSAYRGFFGCNHFYKTNQILLKINKTTIQW